MAGVDILSAHRFENEVEKSSDTVLVDFYADWCGPCRMVAPVLNELADEYQGKVKIVKVDADQSPEILAKYGVRGIPTMMLFKAGEVIDTRVGSQPAQALRVFLDEHA